MFCLRKTHRSQFNLTHKLKASILERRREKLGISSKKKLTFFPLVGKFFFKSLIQKKNTIEKKDFIRSVSNRDFIHYILAKFVACFFFRLIKDSLCFQHEENLFLKKLHSLQHFQKPNPIS